MTETVESIRKDSAVRQVQQKEIVDWSGKRFVPPRGTTLPAMGLPGEIFVLERTSPLRDQVYMWDAEYNNWSTVGPG